MVLIGFKNSSYLYIWKALILITKLIACFAFHAQPAAIMRFPGWFCVNAFFERNLTSPRVLFISLIFSFSIFIYTSKRGLGTVTWNTIRRFVLVRVVDTRLVFMALRTSASCRLANLFLRIHEYIVAQARLPRRVTTYAHRARMVTYVRMYQEWEREKEKEGTRRLISLHFGVNYYRGRINANEASREGGRTLATAEEKKMLILLRDAYISILMRLRAQARTNNAVLRGWIESVRSNSPLERFPFMFVKGRESLLIMPSLSFSLTVFLYIYTYIHFFFFLSLFLSLSVTPRCQVISVIFCDARSNIARHFARGGRRNRKLCRYFYVTHAMAPRCCCCL